MHGLSIRLAVLAIALAAGGPAAAASKLSVAPFGTKGAAASKQIEEALCGRLECVDWEAVSTRGAKDLAKARAQGVGGLLVGGAFDQGGKRLLGLNLYKGSANAARSWSFALGADGKLKAADLAALQAGVSGMLGGAAPAPAASPTARKAAPEKVAAPPKAPAKAATPAKAPVPLKVAPRPIDEQPKAPEAAPAPAAPPRAPAAAPPRAAPPTNVSGQPIPSQQPRPMKDAFAWPKPAREEPRTHPYLAVELGALVTDRHLSYSGGSGGALQLFDVSLFSSPRGRVELYPLAGSDDLMAGLGVFGDYTRSVGFKTKVGTEKLDTTFARLRAGLLWRLPLGDGFALVPALSYETLQLAVSPRVVGLPDAALAGFRGGLGAELAVHPRVTLLAGAGYVLWTGAKDLVKGDPVFFPGGSAAALEAEAGVGVKLVDWLSVRALGEYSRTSYSLDQDATSSAYDATGATDAYLGFRVMLRAQY